MPKRLIVCRDGTWSDPADRPTRRRESLVDGTERFTFDVPSGVRAKVHATLTYYYSPMSRTESGERVVFRNLSRLVR